PGDDAGTLLRARRRSRRPDRRSGRQSGDRDAGRLHGGRRAVPPPRARSDGPASKDARLKMEVFDTAADRAFRLEVRGFLAENLTDEMRRAVQNLGNLIDRPSLMTWHKTLLERGWAATSWPSEY